MKNKAWVEAVSSDKTLKIALGGKIVATGTRFVDTRLRGLNLDNIRAAERDGPKK